MAKVKADFSDLQRETIFRLLTEYRDADVPTPEEVAEQDEADAVRTKLLDSADLTPDDVAVIRKVIAAARDATPSMEKARTYAKLLENVED